MTLGESGDHLVADGTGLAGGQVTVVAIGLVDADLRSGLHLELVHSLGGQGKAKPLSLENDFFFPYP